MKVSDFGIADLVTFTEETLNGKLYFLCTVCAFNEHMLKRNHMTK